MLEKNAEVLANTLREAKLFARQTVDGTIPRGGEGYAGLQQLEVVFVRAGQGNAEGLYIFCENGRMMRPIQDLKTGKLLFVGSWEQMWLDIAGVPSDLVDAKRTLNKLYTYIEQSGANIISLTSETIPFFEHNCSPRNLFQCGLSKQSSGTQLQAMAWRREAKLFRMPFPQRYLVRTLPMDILGLDDFSLGVNAVVAVLSYTGYDMDDAVVVNHTSAQRGMLTAMITVTHVVDLASHGGPPSKEGGTTVFYNLTSEGTKFSNELNNDGFPPKRIPSGLVSMSRDHQQPGLLDSTPVYCTARRFERIDNAGNTVYEYTRHHVTRWRSFDKGEHAWIHSVVPLAFSGPDCTSALFVFRIPRPPTVGDKFSSRHGQKGTLPILCKAVDFPFSARGMTPDVIINPHAFPSRMTLGMVLEIISGKLGALHGRFFDHTAWSTADEDPVVAERVGDCLAKLGFQRHGRETMYCGKTGQPMEAEVFLGVCGYQRLRHMVNDKWQSRARTDFHHRAVTTTGQPVKGRKRHGGVRVGEMERDGLLSHGIAEVVLDRLLHVSDKTKAFICTQCGGLQMCIYEKHTSEFTTWKVCKYCGAGGESSDGVIQLMDIPQVLRLWVAELMSVGVRVAIQVQ